MAVVVGRIIVREHTGIGAEDYMLHLETKPLHTRNMFLNQLLAFLIRF